MLERIIKSDLYEHLEVNGLISKYQHGFVRRKSCTSNLIETLDKITNALWGQFAVDVVYLDTLKAFETVPYQRLLLKIEKYGIGGKTLNWINIK